MDTQPVIGCFEISFSSFSCVERASEMKEQESKYGYLQTLLTWPEFIVCMESIDPFVSTVQPFPLRGRIFQIRSIFARARIQCITCG